jgi:hypothetical protein
MARPVTERSIRAPESTGIHRARERLVRLAKKTGVELRQS